MRLCAYAHKLKSIVFQTLEKAEQKFQCLEKVGRSFPMLGKMILPTMILPIRTRKRIVCGFYEKRNIT